MKFQNEWSNGLIVKHAKKGDLGNLARYNSAIHPK